MHTAPSSTQRSEEYYLGQNLGRAHVSAQSYSAKQFTSMHVTRGKRFTMCRCALCSVQLCAGKCLAFAKVFVTRSTSKRQLLSSTKVKREYFAGDFCGSMKNGCSVLVLLPKLFTDFGSSCNAARRFSRTKPTPGRA